MWRNGFERGHNRLSQLEFRIRHFIRAFHSFRMKSTLGSAALHPRWRHALGMPVRLFVMFACSAVADGSAQSPIGIELFEQFASFTNSNHPDNRIGYRFHEHTPLTYGDVPPPAAVGKRPATDAMLFSARPGVKTFHRRVTEDGWISQDWTFHLAPVADGIEMLLVVKTGDVGLPEFYGIQQCFRLTGTANEAWRQKYARTAAFSEYDLWRDSPVGKELVSLTQALHNGSLKLCPAGKETVGCRTPYGEALDTRRSGGHLDTLEFIGAYRARMLWTADSGLILRTSADKKWSTGLFWERTTHLSDHHPADCLHAIVNIGGIAPNSQRVLRGKIYWLAGSGETLVKHWREDFLRLEGSGAEHNDLK